MGLLLVFFFLSIIFSFACSVWEAVLLSITPSYVNAKMESGSPIGTKLQEFKKDIDRPLSAILTLNTIAHTVGAIGVGAQAAVIFGNDDINIGGLHLSYESIIAGLMTLAILILSEIIPKTIGANMWKSLAPFTVKSLSVLLKLLFPFVWISQLITKGLKKEKDKSVLSRADFLALANVGKDSGALQEKESHIIANLLGLNKLTVHDVMTPRPVMQSADETITIRDYYDQNKIMRFSRIPVFKDDPDNIVGLVLKDVILQEILEGRGEEPLSRIKREISMIGQDKSLSELFDHLTENRQHISVVVDKFGSITGLVTMEDLFETILGMEIMDEFDEVADLQALARKRWNERAKKLGLIE